ncbi:MAG: acyltransferase [Terracidiphilus sp.]|jgi:peptidoglycan/LPS O-acetylase OafA/YrhL
MLKRITGPGLFRLFLALMVFVHHVTRFAVGGSAVLVFFCLSGFWIYKMYTGRYSATRQPYLTYIVSRAWRLLPTFWLVTAITLLFLYFHGTLASYLDGPDRIHCIVSNLFILGYSTMREQPVGSAWSLDIEMQFYLIAPFIAVYLARRKAVAAWFLLAIAAASLASFLLHNPVTLVSYLVFFVVGMTAASVDWRPSGRLVIFFLGAIALAVVLCLASPWRGILLVGEHPGPLSIYTRHANVALALLTMPYAIYTTRQKGFRADGMFADLSYIVYLLHWTAFMWIASHPGGMLHRIAYMAVAWVLVSGLSLVIWKFYDHPINLMRSRWVSGRKKGATAKARLGRVNTI